MFPRGLLRTSGLSCARDETLAAGIRYPLDDGHLPIVEAEVRTMPVMMDVTERVLTRTDAKAIIIKLLAYLTNGASDGVGPAARQVLDQLRRSQHWDAWYGRDFRAPALVTSETPPMLFASILGTVGGLALVCPETELRTAVDRIVEDDRMWELLERVRKSPSPG
jgi:hypothetical protein